MDTEKNFTLHMQSPGRFFFNAPNVEYEGNEYKNHLPSMVERRLDDLGKKYYLMALAFRKLSELTSSIDEKYDRDANTLQVAEDYWELVLFLNHFLFEARSLLDVLAKILRLCHANKLPKSFNEIQEEGKHQSIFLKDLTFYHCLVAAKSAEWMNYLLSSDGKTSLRDRATHYTVAQVKIFPDKLRERLIFQIQAGMKAEHPMVGPGLDLMATTKLIHNGVRELLDGFKVNYTQARIRALLGVGESTEGLFEI